MLDQPYDITNGDIDLAQVLDNFNAEYVIHVMEDMLANRDYNNLLEKPNLVTAFENYFNIMRTQYLNDGENINQIRSEMYDIIISKLCSAYNLKFNFDDESISHYTAATFLYEFLISKYNAYIINFFTSFIINNKNTLFIGLKSTKAAKEPTIITQKIDPELLLISNNIAQVINLIYNYDIDLDYIFKTIYPDPRIAMMMSTAFADYGNFFRDHYCAILANPEVLPVITVNIREQLNGLLGTASANPISSLL